MRSLCTLLLIITALVSAAAVADGLGDNMIRVQGQGSVSDTPDLLHFTLQVEEKGELASKLYPKIEQKTSAIIDLLLRVGVIKQDIQSMNVNLQPWFSNYGGERQQKGFVLSQEIRVSLRDFNQFPAILDGSFKIGASGLYGVSYAIEDPHSQYLKALDLALENAKARASRIAKNIGRELGEVVQVNEQSGYSPRPQMAEVMSYRGKADSMQPGSMAVNAQLDVFFRLK